MASRRLARRRSSSSSSKTSSTTATTTDNTGGNPTTPAIQPPHVHPHPYRLQPTLVPLSLSSLPRSPSYLGTAYAELSFPPLRRAGGGGRVSEMIAEVDEEVDEVEEEEGEEGEESEGEKVAARNYADVDCRMCLKKAVSRIRTRCCNTVFCRAHIDEWLEREESKGLCPMCDEPCVLARTSPPPLSVSACRSRISLSSSTSTTSGTLAEEGWWESEAEDTWDVNGVWKKSDGGSLDVKEMVRIVVGESLQFVGLVWVGHQKESSGATMRVASVVGLVLVLFVLLR